MKKHTYTFSVLAIFSILFWCLPAYFNQSEALQNATAQTRDLFFRIRHFSSPVPEAVNEIVIITIDEESCERLQARWPWPRRTFADLVRALHKGGAKVIGLNVAFTGLEGGEEASSEEFAQAVREHGNVIVGATFDKESRLVKPNPIIAEAVSRVGYLEKVIDPDFSIRRSYLLRPYLTQTVNEAFESSFPLQITAASAAGKRGSEPRFNRDRGIVSIGDPSREIFLAADGSYTINYLAAERDFTKIPAWKVIQGKFPAGAVKGKVALVGLTSSLFSDMHQTPFGIMSGIGVHANEFLAIVSGRFLRFAPDGLTFFISWFVSCLVLALFLWRRFWLGIVGFVIALFGLFLAAQMTFARDTVLEPLILILGPFLSLVTGIVSNSLKLLLENKGLETKVIQDKMTGLYTYDFLRVRLHDEWKRCQKAKVPLSVVMTDLDRFKKINDTLGHEVGNEMIRRTAKVIKESVRGYDIVSRYGGDEFVILLWHAGHEEARAYRIRLRDMYHAMAKKLEPALQDSSISIGIATYDPSLDAHHPPDPQTLVEEADKDLFTDKESRRKGPSR